MRRIKASTPGLEDFGILGEWYTPFDMMLNDLGFWFPILQRTGVPVPKTIIIGAGNNGDHDLISLLDGMPKTPWIPFLTRLRDAMDEIGYPCFFRGGQSSVKHDWENTCFVKERPTLRQLLARVMAVVEHCVMGNIGATPLLYETWAVRNMIPTTPMFHHFSNMPIVREARFFLRDGEIDCWHPYWPKEALREGQIPAGKYEELCEFSAEDLETLYDMSRVVAGYFPGYWSCDFLQASNGAWVCTDMAQGEDSYHYPGCPKKTK